MIKPNKYFDFILLSTFSFFVVLGIYQYFVDGFTVYLNNILAAILLIYGIFLKVKRYDKSRFVVICLLALSTFGIINFVFATVARIGELPTNSFAFIQYPGIDPITLLIFIIYCFVNRSFFWECYHLLFHGTGEAQKRESEKQIEFYYKKFSTIKNDDLERIFKIYNEYPVEAQMALKAIHEERRLKFLSF
jgi:hypothetical protein